MKTTLMQELREVRESKSINQHQVAKKMNTSPTAISRLERKDGKHSPSLRTIESYSNAIGVTVEFKVVNK
jgi:transcriptional regulator with XRE-family HTH domain